MKVIQKSFTYKHGDEENQYSSRQKTVLAAAAFATDIGKDAVISITERTESSSRIGDDGMFVVSVWYWSERTEA